MRIYKFGGTSIVTRDRLEKIIKIISDDEKKIIVFSAVSGTTNTLYKIANLIQQDEIKSAEEQLKALYDFYEKYIDDLFQPQSEFKKKAQKDVSEIFNKLKLLINNYSKDLHKKYENEIVAQGEFISTHIIHNLLLSRGINNVLLNALNFIRKKEDKDEPDIEYTKDKLLPVINQSNDISKFIIQGFICLNANNEVDNLQRGGSDYTASIIGAALDAEEIQIWTDINGIHNNDPRYVNNTKKLHKISFDEVAELAYFGAKVLHPTCILPAKEKNIPVVVKNTLKPSQKGTIISNFLPKEGFRAIASKDGITMIQIQSYRMLMAYGFLKAIFEIFNDYKTPIDMITTSEVAVSVTIDNTQYLDLITEKLSRIATVKIFQNQTIICVVGYIPKEKPGYLYKVSNALKNIPINMLSYGGSDYNISILIDEKYKKQALEQLHSHLFSNK